MKDFIGTNEQLCNALDYIEARRSTSQTDMAILRAAQAKIAELATALKKIAENDHMLKTRAWAIYTAREALNPANDIDTTKQTV
jgi:hypothetical protein